MLVLILMVVKLPDIVQKVKFRQASRVLREETEARLSASTRADFPVREFRLIVDSEDEEEALLNVSLSLAYQAENEDLENELVQEHAQIHYVLSNLIQGKMLEEIDEEPEKVLLKEEIKETVNALLDEGKVESVYFQEFVFLSD